MADKAVKLTTILVACMPLLGLKPMVWVLIAWLLSIVIYQVSERQSFTLDIRRLFLLGGLFILMLLDLLRAENLELAWKSTERSVVLLVIPLAFIGLSFPFHSMNRRLLLDVFAIAALIFGLYANIFIAIKGLPQMDATFSHIYRQAFSDIPGIQHPLYASYFFTTGILFLAHNCISETRGRNWRLAIVAVLAIFALLCASRMPLFAIIVALAFLMSKRLRSNRRSTVISGVGIAILIMLMTPSINDRMDQLFSTEIAIPKGGDHNSVNVRAGIGYCTLDLLEENWLFGLGSGGSYEALGACTISLNPIAYTDVAMDTHSQPFHYWLELGIAGLVLFIALIAYSMQSAWNKQDLLHLSFLIFMLLCMLTENLLSRQMGIVLFVFWNTYFLCLPKVQPSD